MHSQCCTKCVSSFMATEVLHMCQTSTSVWTLLEKDKICLSISNIVIRGSVYHVVNSGKRWDWIFHTEHYYVDTNCTDLSLFRVTLWRCRLIVADVSLIYIYMWGCACVCKGSLTTASNNSYCSGAPSWESYASTHFYS